MRRLSPEEAALWQKVISSVKPLAATPARPPVAAAAPPRPAKAEPRPLPMPAVKLAPPPPQKPKPRAEVRDTLDGSWDRRLSRGLVSPESTVDLHGHSLATAYDRLDLGLAQAIQHGDRVLLLVTGKPPRKESERPHARGAIRATVDHWLAASRHARHIAAVRSAHPRHGGAGALYIVLRRQRSASARNS